MKILKIFLLSVAITGSVLGMDKEEAAEQRGKTTHPSWGGGGNDLAGGDKDSGCCHTTRVIGCRLRVPPLDPGLLEAYIPHPVPLKARAAPKDKGDQAAPPQCPGSDLTGAATVGQGKGTAVSLSKELEASAGAAGEASSLPVESGVTVLNPVPGSWEEGLPFGVVVKMITSSYVYRTPERALVSNRQVPPLRGIIVRCSDSVWAVLPLDGPGFFQWIGKVDIKPYRPNPMSITTALEVLKKGMDFLFNDDLFQTPHRLGYILPLIFWLINTPKRQSPGFDIVESLTDPSGGGTITVPQIELIRDALLSHPCFATQPSPS